MGHTKRRRINHNCYCFLIGIHPHLQAIGVECAVRVFPTPEEGDPRFKLPKSRHKKLQLPPLSNTWPLRKHFNQVYYVEECFFLRKKIDRFWADTANPDIHNLAYLQNHRQRPAFHGTPTQSRKIALRPINTKDFGTLGVDRGTELSFNLWPSLQPRNCYFSETTKM